MSRYVTTREQKVATREKKVSLGGGCVGSVCNQSDRYQMNNDPSWFGGNKKQNKPENDNSWLGGKLVQKDVVPKLLVVVNDADNIHINTDI